MKAVNSPWHDPLSSELCCSRGPYTPKAFCSPQGFPQRRPLGSHPAARGYLSQALIFSVDLSWLLPYPQVFFRGLTKNQSVVKSGEAFHPFLLQKFLLPVGIGSFLSWSGLGGALGTSGGCVGLGANGQDRWDDVVLYWAGLQPVPISTGTLEVALSCQPREPRVPLCSPP